MQALGVVSKPVLKMFYIKIKRSFNMEQVKEDRIQVVLCEPGKKARVTTIMKSLESLSLFQTLYLDVSHKLYHH